MHSSTAVSKVSKPDLYLLEYAMPPEQYKEVSHLYI